MTTPDIPASITLPVEFHLDPDCWPDLLAEARSIDAHNNGQVAVEYTVEQAFTVVFHEDGMEGLIKTGILVGWTVEKDLGWGPMRPATAEDEHQAAADV